MSEQFRPVCWIDYFDRVPHVVLRNGQCTDVMPVKHWDERHRDYGPDHKSWAQQKIENGYVETNEDPRTIEKCDCMLCFRTEWCVKKRGHRTTR